MNHNLLVGTGEPCSSQQQNKQGGMIEADWGRSWNAARSQPILALKTVKHQHSSWFLYYTRDRKEGWERACVRESGTSFFLAAALPFFFCTQSTWRLAKVIRHCSLSPPLSSPRRTHATPLSFFFSFPHMSHCASCLPVCYIPFFLEK
jgi:hypothetical protein